MDPQPGGTVSEEGAGVTAGEEAAVRAAMIWLVGVALAGAAGGLAHGVADDPAAPQSAGAPVVVRTVPELKAALRAGRTWIAVHGELVFRSPADRIVLDELVPPGISFVTIEGGGTFGSGLYRAFHDNDTTRALIEAYYSERRHWHLRLRGLVFSGAVGAEHTVFYRGQALRVDHAQLSLFEDLRFQNFTGARPFTIGAAHATSAAEFRDVVLDWNEREALILNASDVRWRGGALQTDWGTRGSGLIIRGIRHDPPPAGRGRIAGPVLIEDVAMEGSGIHVIDVHKPTFRGGYIMGSSISMVNVTNPFVQCNGYFAGALMVVNGARMYHDGNGLPCSD
jgi:hypothetical protein